MEKAGLPAPEYKDSAFMLNVTIKNEAKNEVKHLPDKEQLLINFIKHNSSVTIVEMAELLNISKSTADRIIRKLKENGILYRSGSLKKGKWHIIE